MERPRLEDYEVYIGDDDDIIIEFASVKQYELLNKYVDFLETELNNRAFFCNDCFKNLTGNGFNKDELHLCISCAKNR